LIHNWPGIWRSVMATRGASLPQEVEKLEK
jgi:hypothetical protein